MRSSFPYRLLAWFIALSFLVSCGGDEPIDPTPVTPVTPVDPDPPTPETDTTAPTITVSRSSINVISGPTLTVSGNELKIGDDLVASWKDDKSTTCTVTITFTAADNTSKTINSGDKLSEEGNLQIKATDEAGNSSTADITLTKNDTKAPEIEVKISKKNVIAGVKISVQENQLLFDQDIAAIWKDDYSETFTVELYLFVDGCEPESINPGDMIAKAGVLKIHVSDEFQNKTIAEIALTAVAITGLENLENLSLQVDQEVNLLQGLAFADGLTLSKVEVEQDGGKTVVPNPYAFVPEFPGIVSIILSLARPDGSTIEVKVDNLTVNALAYSKLTVTDLKPVDILPIIGQIEIGDKNVYSYIEHLKVAEATRIRDMMWEYGAGPHSRVDYQGLMSRLHTWMQNEIPKWYEDYEALGGLWDTTPTDHATTEWSILDILIQHANLNVICPSAQNEANAWFGVTMDYINEHPNCIFVLGNSTGATHTTRSSYNAMYIRQALISLLQSKNLIYFVAGTNVTNPSTWILNKIFNEEYDLDEHGVYSSGSLANSDKNHHPDRHILVTIGTNKLGDIDQTGVRIESTRFPIGFADNVLFSGRAFPENMKGQIYWRSGRYPTSDSNYFNVALASICFQLFAEVADVDQLLEMIRATCLTDHIHLDLNEDGDTNDIHEGHPETVPLQLINPAGFFKKYDMPSSLPSTIGMNETIGLEKGYYKGVIFDTPGAEVLIDGQWIAYDAKNKDTILSQNPMNLTWRLNGNLLRKLGYTTGQTIQGQVVTVDDQWNGLRLEVPISVVLR